MNHFGAGRLAFKPIAPPIPISAKLISELTSIDTGEAAEISSAILVTIPTSTTARHTLAVCRRGVNKTNGANAR